MTNRDMGITNLDELPELPDVSTSEGVLKLQEQIEQIKENQQIEGQLSLYDSAEHEEPGEEHKPEEENEGTINTVSEQEETREES